MGAEDAPGMFCYGTAKQPAGFAKVKLRHSAGSSVVRGGVDLAKDGYHFLSVLVTVGARVQAQKALIDD
jgi:hypothetical protein